MKRAIPKPQRTAVEENSFIQDVRSGLRDPVQKHLPPKYFYDDVGSALFEVITRLPEYGLTRADERLIDQHAPAIVSELKRGAVIAELGSGSGTKTRRILSEAGLGGETDYFPIDISEAALERCQAELRAVNGVRVFPIASTYLDGLAEVSGRSQSDAQLLLLFLGSTIGNFERERAHRFLGEIRGSLRPGDFLLLGTDLEKPKSQLLAAYDDPIGVTAAFNKNVLARINRELDGHFDLRAFRHVARYDDECRRVEIHLEALRDQTVSIDAADITVSFRKGETIWTESSHKFSCEEVVRLGASKGFSCKAQWVDRQWPFAETLFVAT